MKKLYGKKRKYHHLSAVPLVLIHSEPLIILTIAMHRSKYHIGLFGLAYIIGIESHLDNQIGLQTVHVMQPVCLGFDLVHM